VPNFEIELTSTTAAFRSGDAAEFWRRKASPSMPLQLTWQIFALTEQRAPSQTYSPTKLGG